MKKLTALMLALAMLLCLGACSGSDNPPATTTPAVTDNNDNTPDTDPTDTPDGEKRVLRVAMECAYAPYNWTQPDDSNGAVPISGSSDYAYGYDVMMAKYICEQLGWELEIVKSDWESIIPAIQSGTVDVGICGQSVTCLLYTSRCV